MGYTHQNRLLILGLDGLNWQLLEPLLGAGIMPVLARLRREGAWGALSSVIPTQSATAWASFITGQGPARHGVLDFMVRQPNGAYRHAKPDPATTVWRYASGAGLRVGVLNFPVTYPPDPIPAGGFLVSGMLSPKGKAFTYPRVLGDEMLAAVPGYRLDLEWQLYSGRERLLLQDVTEMTRQRALAAQYLRDRYSPDFLAVAFIGPDRLQHALWRYLDDGHPDYDRSLAGSWADALQEFYAALDAAIGLLLDGVDGATTILALSDHGFQSAKWQFRVDDWLAENGWLARKGSRASLERLARRLDTPWVRHVRRQLVKDISRHFDTFSPGGTINWSRTSAFCPWNEQQGIRLNVRGREPEGRVSPGVEYERLRDEIHQALLAAVAPPAVSASTAPAMLAPDAGPVGRRTDQRVVDRVWRREDLYDGPFVDLMPDLVFSLRPGFAASPFQQGLWADTGWASGDHSLEGMFVAWGQNVKRGESQGNPAVGGRVTGAELIDMAPTALYVLGQPVPDSMDGQVLTSILDPAFVAANPICRTGVMRSGPDTVPPLQAAQVEDQETDSALSAEEEADIQERLRGLGYL